MNNKHQLNIAVVEKNIEKVWFRQKEAAKWLGVGESTIKDMRLNGTLSYYTFGGTVLIRKSDLERHIKKVT